MRVTLLLLIVLSIVSWIVLAIVSCNQEESEITEKIYLVEMQNGAVHTVRATSYATISSSNTVTFFVGPDGRMNFSDQVATFHLMAVRSITIATARRKSPVKLAPKPREKRNEKKSVPTKQA